MNASVVFDVDDTLYLERDYARGGFEAAAAHARARFGVDDFATRAWALFEQGLRGKGGNLGVVDLATGRNVLFTHDDAPFYPLWQGGPGGEPRFGFDLTPESAGTLATYGLAFVGG